MKFQGLKARKKPLDLSEALITFGVLKDSPPEYAVEAAKLGQRLVREIQYLHKVLADIRKHLPATYGDYIDPARVDTALARTRVRS